LAEPRTVLITRPEPGASETARRLTAMGLRPILAPVLVVSNKAAHLPAPIRIAAILVTSRNAIPAFGPAWHATPFFAVGDATASRASDAGFTAVHSADGDASDLARLVAGTLKPADGTLLLASGKGQGRALAGMLRAAGFRVLHRIVYAAGPAPALPDVAIAALRHHVDAVLFFSTETARHFVRLTRAAGLADSVRDCEAVTISRPVAMALEELPWRRVAVADRPKQDEMLALLR
jgi:uroporphyrinogen-III synthase